MNKLINVYCDESCHLLNDNAKVMVLGAVYCKSLDYKNISDKIRSIKVKHNLPKMFEIKWTKVSPSKLEFYLELIDYFFNEAPLKFRAVLVPDKSLLDHTKYNQTHDDWYYKMYYVMLKWLVNPANTYQFYIDIKDTNGNLKANKLKEYLALHIDDIFYECVTKVQQIRSEESELIQLADLLIGAISHAARQKTGSTAKRAIIDRITTYIPTTNITSRSPYGYVKFNLFEWRAS